MPTSTVTLTNSPQLIASGAAYVTSADDRRFAFAFGAAPSDLQNRHTHVELYTDGTLGALYMWSALQNTNTVIRVSKP